VQIRPEAEQKLRAGFQRRVDQQSQRHARPLANAAEVTTGFECGEVVGVFTAWAGGGVARRAYVVGLAPLAAIPVLIAAAAARIPGLLPLLASFPFLEGAWFGVSLFRGRVPKRDVWWYAFTEGFMLLDSAVAEIGPVRWSQVTAVSETAWRLHGSDGQAYEISLSFQNVRDPYREVGQLLRGLMPTAAGQVRPAFPTVDQVIAAYAGQAGA
jgi:hypothetical protein